MSDLLTMTGISKRFGATQALADVSLSVPAGRVLALIGENGAGKSTLMKVLSGAHGPDSGSMLLAGRPYAPSGPHGARLAGVSMIYQELNLAPDLSVEDNIMLGQEARRVGSSRLSRWLGPFIPVDRAAQRVRVRQALDLLGHPHLRSETRVGDLPIAVQQLVEIARALVSESKVIVFDEPTNVTRVCRDGPLSRVSRDACLSLSNEFVVSHVVRHAVRWSVIGRVSTSHGPQ